jgi:XTP/dITP diphosphohydrolase
MPSLLLATRNAHKAAEIQAILTGTPCLTLRDLPGAPDVEEDAATFAGNATKKAVTLARWIASAPAVLACPPPDFVLADDSGLEVDALGGQPGVHSARFAALEGGPPGNSPDAANNARLLRLLADVPPARRTARFRCVLALVPVPAAPGIESASPVCFADEFEPPARLFEGVCEGRILLSPAGAGGFGYDPLFVPDGFTESFAQLGDEVKNRLSHRARALAGLKAFLGS